jgi:tetratricopeptide (TPR) repeat protein
LVRDALLTGSEIYYKTGQYDLARERAERILKDNPKDKDALSLYMQVKGRGAAPSAAAAGGATNGAAGTAGQAAPRQAANSTATAPRGPAVAMTNAGSLEAQKQIALGWSMIKLDPKEALKFFEAAITADPVSAAVRVQRSRARAAAGDAAGALGDADDAIRMDPGLGEAYAARAEAKRALGRAEAELLADYEAAAKLDGRFTEAYKAVLIRTGGSLAGTETKPAAKAETAGASAPDGPLGLLRRSPQYWGILAFLCAMLAAAGGLVVPLLLKRRRSDEDGSQPR